MMRYEEAVNRFKVFFEEFPTLTNPVYYDKIRKAKLNNQRSLDVDFEHLLDFDFEMAQLLITDPNFVIPSSEAAFEQLYVPREKIDLHVRFYNVAPARVEIRELRSEHINRLVQIDGIVRRTTEVKPEIVEAVFTCVRCGQLMIIEQDAHLFKRPTFCQNPACGRPGPFKLEEDQSKFIDWQMIKIQERPERLRGGQMPRDVDCYLHDDIVDIAIAGNRLTVTGVLKTIQEVSFRGQQKTTFKISIEISHAELRQKEVEDVEITEEDEAHIKLLGSEPFVCDKIVNSIAPAVYGHLDVKEALALQLFSGVLRILPDGTRLRGDSNVLLVGDPGVAKSQLLMYIARIAPRGIYTSGKGTSAAGLTATVIRDETTGGWALEAGALVIADGGIACIDEIDKMSKDDRSSIHEAMEQQSYHPSAEILLSNGEKREIGSFVDSLINIHNDKIMTGRDCEILTLPKESEFRLLTTDFKDIYPVSADRISRHKAPSRFIKILYSNGRSIIVTPEHPIYVLKDGEIKEMMADNVRRGMLSPAPIEYTFEENEVSLIKPEIQQITKPVKLVSFPGKLNRDLCRLLGYIVSEGHTCYSKENGMAEVMISNTDRNIVDDVYDIIQILFGITPYLQRQEAHKRKNAKKDIYTVRCISIPLYKFFKSNFPEITEKSNEKRIPACIFHTSRNNRIQFLLGVFRGDGFYDSERVGYITNSSNLARDYSDLLLSLGIYSYITPHSTYFSNKERKIKKAYKVVISGSDSLKIFYELIGKEDKRKKKLHYYARRSMNRKNDHDRVSVDVVAQLKKLLKDYRLDDGYFGQSMKTDGAVHRKTALRYLEKVESHTSSLCGMSLNDPREIRKKYGIPLTEIASRINRSVSMITYMERNPSTKNHAVLSESIKQLARDKIADTKISIRRLRNVIDSKIRFIEVKSVERIINNGVRWVYDVTVEPNHTFISEGLVLHNTISIAKAGIVATLNARASILAAANPKYGRFDRFRSLVEQIDLPPTLLSRFDLIYIITDKPSEDLDRRIAEHIIATHENPDESISPPVPIDLLEKYVMYAKNNVSPAMTREASKRLLDFYLEMRKGGEAEEAPLPITARQLEALIRLSEARARMRLSDRVTREDAEEVIRLFRECLYKVAIDHSTGKLDIDVLTTGKPKSQRDKVFQFLDLIEKLDRENNGNGASEEEVYKQGMAEGLSAEFIRENISQLKRRGDLYSPKDGLLKSVREY